MACETLPVWRSSEDEPSLSRDCSKDAAARKIYEEVSSSTVRIIVGDDAASGFFVGAGDEIMTNAHVAVAAGREPLRIIAKDGREYTALIEAADEISDLAVLKVQGLVPGTYKPLPLRPSESMHAGQDVFVVGSPGWRSQVYISPGEFEASRSLVSFLNPESPPARKWNALLNSSNSEERAQVAAELQAPRLRDTARTEAGTSGAAVVDSDGFVIGVHASSVRGALASFSLEVPSEPAIHLLNPANRTRKFEYRAETNFWLHPIDTLVGHLRLVSDPVRRVAL